MATIAAMRVVFVVLCSSCHWGCQSALGAGVEAFHHADYPTAARSFREATPEVSAHDAGRYHLYTGLTHLALGNAALAIVHLTQARQSADTDASYFTSDERARLSSAWQAMGKMPGQSLAR